jgi:membrane-bound metal-dependent hydrolase YbcI (DUF457 family)
VYLLAHLGFTAAPGALVARWWGDNRGFKGAAPDLRWLLAGSVLPDVVDKTVGQLLFKPYFENGRIFFHTAVITLAVFAVGAYRQRKRHDNRVLLLALGMASHILLDRIWLEPETAWWPALGPFVRDPSVEPLYKQILEALSDPFFWTSEIAGLALLVASLRHLGVGSLAELKGFLQRGVSPSLVRDVAG